MQASANRYGGTEAVHADEPLWHTLPDREFTPAFLTIREAAVAWLADYYDREHLTRAGDWMLVLAPDAPEYLVLAALLHDVERKVPGGPKLEMDRVGWDDRTYNDAHTRRSAIVVPTWLMLHDAPEDWLTAVAQPIREHEFGGSPEGDLMQAVDSISFLETNSELVASWVRRGMCTPEKGREKLHWMGERVRHERGAQIARVYMDDALKQFEQLKDSGTAAAD